MRRTTPLKCRWAPGRARPAHGDRRDHSIPAKARKKQPSQPRLVRTTLRTSRLLDFCNRKELTAQTGHEPRDWPLYVLKELVDNALDACEEAEVAPKITVAVTENEITVSDNGRGIPASTVQALRDFSIRVSSREAYVAPDRGAQGNALQTILAMPFVLDGSAGTVVVEARGTRHEITMMRVDPIRQEPKIDHRQTASNRKVGTSVRVCQLGDSLAAGGQNLQKRALRLLSDFTWLNPHLTLTVDWRGEKTITRATNPDWPKWRPGDPTSSHWYEPDHLARLIAGYLAHDQDHGQSRTVREFISEFDGFKGSARQKEVLAATELHRAPLSVMLNSDGLDQEKVGSILAAMQERSRPVKHSRLGVIGQDHFRQRFEKVECEMETFNYRKVLDETNGRPEILEVAFGWCPKAGDERRLVTGVNWSAAILNPFRRLGETGRSLDAMLEQLWCGADEEVIIVMHFVTPLAQFTDRGKSAIVMTGGEP